MNIVKTIEQYDDNNIYFCEAIKNNIMNDGSFIRILYSTHHFVINGIYLYINLNDVSIEINNLFILKISGIWETNTNYGLTYKFIKINN